MPRAPTFTTTKNSTMDPTIIILATIIVFYLRSLGLTKMQQIYGRQRDDIWKQLSLKQQLQIMKWETTLSLNWNPGCRGSFTCLSASIQSVTPKTIYIKIWKHPCFRSTNIPLQLLMEFSCSITTRPFPTALTIQPGTPCVPVSMPWEHGGEIVGAADTLGPCWILQNGKPTQTMPPSRNNASSKP